jgi:D-3-phosphoglycerate dehydrogenase / 2-oxoglutarate reductase
VLNTVDVLILDLLEWIGPGSRPYTEVIEAWRTSCPGLPVWEEADERGFLQRRQEPNFEVRISVTALGREFLRKHRPQRSPKAVDGDC